MERKTHSGQIVILSPGFGGKPEPTDLYLKSICALDQLQQPKTTHTLTLLVLICRYMSPESGITQQVTEPSRWCLVLIIYLHSQETDTDCPLTSSSTVTTALHHAFLYYKHIQKCLYVHFTLYKNKNGHVGYVYKDFNQNAFILFADSA